MQSQFARRLRASRGIILTATLALAAGTGGGCGLSTLTSGIGGSGAFGGSTQSTGSTEKISQEQLLTAAKSESSDAGSGGTVSHGCPRFVPWPRDNTLTIYEQGRVGDGLAVMHRGEITKTARECSVDQNKVTIKYGFSGRVLMGPKGRPGTVTLPVTVFVTDAKRQRISAERMMVDATIASEKPIGYFSTVRTVSFAIPEGTRPGEFEVFVGFERNVPGAG